MQAAERRQKGRPRQNKDKNAERQVTRRGEGGAILDPIDHNGIKVLTAICECEAGARRGSAR